MILSLVAALGFQPVLAHAEVTTSNGKAYRVETCFRDPRDLETRFIYPDRTAAFVVAGDKVTVSENAKAPEEAGDREKSFAFGHNFHAIHYNFAKVISDARRADGGSTGALMYGGKATSFVGKDGRLERYRFDLPGTTPIELRFSDWRDGEVPYRLELTHAGVTYDYKYPKVEFRC